MVHGVHRTRRKDETKNNQKQPKSAVSTPLRWIFTRWTDTHLESHATKAQWVCSRAENSAIEKLYESHFKSSIYLIYLSIDLSIDFMYVYMNVCMCLSICRSVYLSVCLCMYACMYLAVCLSVSISVSLLGNVDTSVFRMPDSWLKGRGFESTQERRENFLLHGRLYVLTLISVSVLPQCYRSST